MIEEKFDWVLRQAVALTHIRVPFANESDFKFELFHRLFEMKLDGQPLGQKVLSTSTCMLHAEAKPENGNPSKADLLVCNPYEQNRFNYKVRVIIELKHALNANDLRVEIAKYYRYKSRGMKLYIISANAPRISSHSVTVPSNISVIGPSNSEPLIDYGTVNSSHESLEGRVINAIRSTLELYGRNRDPYHGFFWRNYEHEESKGWTFPVEGDFNAHLYHRLRMSLPNGATVRTEYMPSKEQRHRIDLFIQAGEFTCAIETKMNWDQFRPQYKNSVETVSEATSILEKFRAAGRTSVNHRNFLVVIQGVDGHGPVTSPKNNHKRNALMALKQPDIPFGLFYYYEPQEKTIGPIVSTRLDPTNQH